MRAPAAFCGSETEALKKCGLTAEQFKQTYHLDTPIKLVIQSSKSANDSIGAFTTGLTPEVPNHGAIILVTDGPEGICDDIALWTAFAARWHDITI